METMTVTSIPVQRFSIISSKSFESVLLKINEVVGHPDIPALFKEAGATPAFADLERVIQKGLGTSGMMEFTRFDIGAILRKERGTDKPRILRLVIGNPLIMKQMAAHVPDTASYAPVTILIDERPDGVHLSYDRMASYLAPYGNAEALKVAQALDTKVESLLTAAAT